MIHPFTKNMNFCDTAINLGSGCIKSIANLPLVNLNGQFKKPSPLTTLQ